jgi:hypothetical protein
MAFSWNEKYATLITAKTWNESVEGYKITNVFGLAWNYYIAYTKFITGLDLTLDFGYKIETFYANCYKLGYAQEFKSNTYESAKIEKSRFACLESKELILKKRKDAAEEEVKLVGKITKQIGEELKEVATLQQNGATSTEQWTVSKTIVSDAILLGADSMVTVQVGATCLQVAPGGVVANGPIIELA